MANNKRVFVPVFKDSIKSLRGKDGKSHTTVSMKIDGEKKYGELFFNDSDLQQSQKNKNLMLLGLDADRSYNVGFKDGTYSNWEYEKMTGQQISEANKAYVADKQAEKDSFQSKLDAGIAKAAQEAAAEPYTFTDGTNVYTLEELRNYRSGVIDTFDWHTMDFEIDEAEAHAMGLHVVETVLSHEMGQYFGDMTSKEKRQLIEMCDNAYIYRKPLAEGKLGALMNLEGDMACSGYHIYWDAGDGMEKQTEKESVKAMEQEPEKMSEKASDVLAEKPLQQPESKNAASDKAVVQMKDSSIKPLPNHPGRSYASIGLNSEHGTYGNIYFSDKSLKTPRSNPDVRLLYLNPDKEYNVAFSNPDTDKWEYHNMTGREISDGNRAYLKERGLVKDAVTERPLPDIADSMESLQSDAEYDG